MRCATPHGPRTHARSCVCLIPSRPSANAPSLSPINSRSTQRWLLPGNTSKFEKNLLAALYVLPSSDIKGKKLVDTGLRDNGVRVEAILRRGKTIRNPQPTEVVEEHDTLYVSGELLNIEFAGEEHVLKVLSAEEEESVLAADTEGLVAADGAIFAVEKRSPFTKLLQADLREDSSLVGKTLADAGLRKLVDARVVAVKRQEDRKDGVLSDIVLAPGDRFILDTASDYLASDERLVTHFENVETVKDGVVKEFVVDVVVTKSSDLIGRTITGAGLRGIPGLYVISLAHPDGAVVDAHDHEVKIEANDVLVFAADLKAVTFLSKFPGLQLLNQPQVEKTGVNILDRVFIQAAVSPLSPLLGRTVRDVDFRRKYGAAVVAVHRQDQRVAQKVHELRLEAGDILLLSSSTTWAEEHQHDEAFVLVSEVPDSSPHKTSRMWLALFLTVSMVLTQVVSGLMEMNGVRAHSSIINVACACFCACCCACFCLVYPLVNWFPSRHCSGSCQLSFFAWLTAALASQLTCSLPPASLPPASGRNDTPVALRDAHRGPHAHHGLLQHCTV